MNYDRGRLYLYVQETGFSEVKRACLETKK